MKIHDFYQKAKQFIISKGFENDIKWVESLNIKKTTALQFRNEYIWCVLNAGMREQVARKIYNNFLIDFDLSKIRHGSKRVAIEKALKYYEGWFKEVLAAINPFVFLKTLSWIGDINKFHLARNIGIDCVKPDRHLSRMAEKFGFNDPLEMCKEIQKITNEKLGVIDIVLWRYANLRGSKKSQLKQKELEIY
ncbi:MAG: hypothetical protein EAX89_15475 [Candidatus Lokiarchaeota archaeon]|nr:hypothetical protein [Candidatus Lokiarchaeota archaeon]